MDYQGINLINDDLCLEKSNVNLLTFPHPLGWVATSGTSVFLDVQGSATTTAAHRVRLVMTLTKAAGTLSLQCNETILA